VTEALPGWYPDPAGQPGRFRYWDGSTWSAETTERPGPTGPSSETGSNDPKRPRRTLPMVLAVVTALVIIAIVAVVVITPRVRPVTGEPLPTSTVSGGDDRSPTPTPTPPGSPSPSSASPAPLIPCPEGNPNFRQAHPADGRVHGGNLSFPEEPTFDAAAAEPRFSFAHDVTQQTKIVDSTPPWIAQLAVGRLRAEDGFVKGARNTAQSLVQCAISSALYEPYEPSRADRRSHPINLDGRQGWLIETDITVANTELDFPGDRAIFIVVANGEDWGMFFGAVPIGDALLEDVLYRTVRDLRAR
jgi:hypothetical protein